MYNKWSEAYNQFKSDNPNNRFTQIENSINKTPWFKNLNVNRKFITTISRLRFGHASFAQHLMRIGVVQTEICTTCGVVCDLDHIFFGCTRNFGATNELVKQLVILKIPMPTNLLHLLSLKNINIYKELMRFLNNTKQLL